MPLLPSANSTDFWKRFVASACILLAFVMIALEVGWIQDVFAARHASSWTKVRGAVVRSTIDRGMCERQFEPEVRYTYKVDSHSYEGRRISIGVRECTTEAQAQRLAAQFPIGGVDVFVDPERPDSSALIVGAVSRSTFANMERAGVLLGACVLGAVMLLWPIRSAHSGGQSRPSK